MRCGGCGVLTGGYFRLVGCGFGWWFDCLCGDSGVFWVLSCVLWLAFEFFVWWILSLRLLVTFCGLSDMDFLVWAYCGLRFWRLQSVAVLLGWLLLLGFAFYGSLRLVDAGGAALPQVCDFGLVLDCAVWCVGVTLGVGIGECGF